MAEQITLANLANLENENTAVGAINNNNSVITAAFQDVLSLSGVSPNKMNSPLDMNSFPIMNLPAPGSANSPARLVDVTSSNPISISLSLSGDATAPASSGVLTTTVGKVNGVTYPASPSTNTVPVVTGANTVAYQQVAAAQIANNTITATQVANNTLTAAQLVNNTVGNGQIRQGAALSVVGVTGNSTANVADITGTTRQVLAVSTAGTSLVFAQPRGDQLLGTNTNDNASSGNVGEYISSTIVQGSAVALTTNTPANITSISLTAGDWDVWANFMYNPAVSTTVTNYQGSISLVSATQDTTPGRYFNMSIASVTPGANVQAPGVSFVRLSLSTTTTVFMVSQCGFGTSTMGGFGIIQARRVR